MKFGATLLRSRIPEWAHAYIDFNRAKKLLSECISKYLADVKKRKDTQEKGEDGGKEVGKEVGKEKSEKPDKDGTATAPGSAAVSFSAISNRDGGNFKDHSTSGRSDNNTTHTSG